MIKNLSEILKLINEEVVKENNIEIENQTSSEFIDDSILN